MSAITGHCLCGAVTVALSDPAGWVGVCHCRMCQRWSGSVWAGFPAMADTVTVSGPVESFASSAIAERAFCSTCGTHLWMRDTKTDAPYDLMPGLFDETHSWPLNSEVYSDAAMACISLEGTHKRASAAAYREQNPDVGQVR